MTTIELINSLTWPTAFAIVGSVVTIMVTVLGFMLKIRTPASTIVPTVPTVTDQALHDRISESKDLAQQNSKDVGVLQSQFQALQKEVDSDRLRDQRDFETITAKYEKLLSIVMKILRDEKL